MIGAPAKRYVKIIPLGPKVALPLGQTFTMASFVDHLCYLCLVFVTLLRLFIAALWSPEGKGLISWLLFVMFIVILLFSHLAYWDRCGPDPCCLSYFF